MNDIDRTLLSPRCECKLCLNLPTDGVEKKLFARSMAIYQELEVFCCICSNKDFQFNTATADGAIAEFYLWHSPPFLKIHLVSLGQNR